MIRIQFHWVWAKYFFSPFILLLFWSFNQTADAQNLLDEIHYVYSDLDSSETSTGILINRTYGGPIERFQGKSSDSTASRSDWFQAYFDLWNTSYITPSVPDVDSVQRIISYYTDQDIVPIGMIHKRYDQISHKAYNDSFIYFDTTSGIRGEYQT